MTAECGFSNNRPNNSKPATRNSLRILYLIPFLLTMLIIPLSLINVDKPVGDMIGEIREASQETDEVPRWSYLFTQFRVIVTYIRLLFLPINQNLDYDYPIYHSFSDPNVFLSFLFLLSVFCIGVYLLYRSRAANDPFRSAPCALRLVSFGIFWFFITLSVESSFIPIRDVIFEHRVYLFSIGAFISISISLTLLTSKILDKWPKLKNVSILVFLMCILLFSVISFSRNNIWQDNIKLWNDVVKKSSKKSRGHYNLACSYDKQHRLEEAIREYKIALEISPWIGQIHNNLGSAYLDKGWINDAIDEFKTALNFNPNLADTYYNLGRAYAMKNQIDDAISAYTKALKLNPNDSEAHYRLEILFKTKRLVKK